MVPSPSHKTTLIYAHHLLVLCNISTISYLFNHLTAWIFMIVFLHFAFIMFYFCIKRITLYDWTYVYCNRTKTKSVVTIFTYGSHCKSLSFILDFIRPKSMFFIDRNWEHMSLLLQPPLRLWHYYTLTVSWHTEKVSPLWSSHPPASGG